MTDAADTPEDARNEDLVYDGICPVCGDEFIDGYGDLEEDESYEARICVVEIDGEGEGAMLVHLEESESGGLTPEEAWEKHNNSFQYDAPDLPGDLWSSEQYQELYDRVISRRTKWFCDKCTGKGPMSSLKKARRHVESNHSQDLIEKHETPRDEQDTATDGGTSQDSAARRQDENQQITEWSE